MHPSQKLVEQFKVGRSTVDHTDKIKECKRNAFGEEVPFIVFEVPAGTLIGWVAICVLAGTVELKWIEAKDGGEERGDRMLKGLCNLADNLGVALKLQAAPWDESRLDDLIDWYEANGFVLDAPPRNQRRDQLMTRKPRTSPSR